MGIQYRRSLPHAILKTIFVTALSIPSSALFSPLSYRSVTRFFTSTSRRIRVAKNMQQESRVTQSWVPTRSEENLDPKKLVNGCPQMAKDVDFAHAVLKAWDEELAIRVQDTVTSETKQLQYIDSTDGTTLNGHVIRRQKEREAARTSVPGILFFHTSAGPHDVSLMWKADSLVCSRDTFPDGCVVLVTDIVGDDVGWGWSPDRTKFNRARESVLGSIDGKGERPVLQSRIRAAVNTLKEVAPEVDTNRLAALGWCLGGYSILEMGRMKISGVKAMITFHGVFGEVTPPDLKRSQNDAEGGDILICNGKLDPFVDQEASLRNAIELLEKQGHSVRLMNLAGAKHGFSNPAQDFNPDEAFAYNSEAAEKSWTETLSLLKKNCSLAKTRN